MLDVFDFSDFVTLKTTTRRRGRCEQHLFTVKVVIMMIKAKTSRWMTNGCISGGREWEGKGGNALCSSVGEHCFWTIGVKESMKAESLQMQTISTQLAACRTDAGDRRGLFKVGEISLPWFSIMRVKAGTPQRGAARGLGRRLSWGGKSGRGGRGEGHWPVGDTLFADWRRRFSAVECLNEEKRRILSGIRLTKKFGWVLEWSIAYSMRRGWNEASI
jgi:hypothetical protein